MNRSSGTITERLGNIRSRIEVACERADRNPSEVELVAVSKMHPAGAVLEAFQAGQLSFGESYVQRWLARAEDPRIGALATLRWHFIGSLQRNKIRFLLGRVHCIETVDRIKLARELSHRALTRPGGMPQQVLLQVNLAEDPQKSGFSKQQLLDHLQELAELPGLSIDGLMAIPPARAHPEATRSDHRALRELRDQLRDSHALALATLSMGMSTDFEVAIEEGSTRVRIGTGIFGPRPRAT